MGHYFKDNLKQILSVLQLAFSRSINKLEIKDGEKIIYFSNKFGLCERIGSKIGDLKNFLEEELKNYFYKKYYENLKRNFLSLESCSRINFISKELNIPVVFLKGSALLLEGKVKIGSRNMADVDILVPEKKAKIFFDYLKENGYNSSKKIKQSIHHLPPLYDSFCVMEIHTKIPYLVLKQKKDYIDFEEIEGLGGLKNIFFQGQEYLILNQNFSFAYLLVHSFFQHYDFPDYYNSFQGLSDLQDLGIPVSERKKLIGFVHEHFYYPIKEDFIYGLFNLLDFLENSCGENLNSLNKIGKKIFFHLINGCLDEKYIYSLRLKGIKKKYFFSGFLKRNVLVARDLIFYFIKETLNAKSFWSILKLLKKPIKYFYYKFYVIIKSFFYFVLKSNKMKY